jgi:cyclopropane fatty-acyl-phospholipid synthase-like methyltransferase
VTENNEWITFFDRHASKYMEEVFTQNTAFEVKFILAELALPPGSSILDMGCGVGRHAIEFAKNGYGAIGVDISSGMLNEASRRAAQAGVEVEWVQADASRFRLMEEMDAAVCLCEGAFGLLGSADDPFSHDLAILKGIHASIKPGSKFILTALNGMAKIRKATQDDVDQGVFDPTAQLEMFSLEVETEGVKESIVLRERGFVPSELRLMLEISGFIVENIYGGTAGAWNREPVKLDEIEIMAISHKESDGSHLRL